MSSARITAVSAAVIGAGVDWLITGMDSSVDIVPNFPCTKNLAWASGPSRSRGLRQHRPNYQFISFLQVAVKDGSYLRICMVGDAQRHFHRLHGVVAVEFPDHRIVGARRTRLNCAWPDGRRLFRGGNFIASQSSLAAFNAVLLVKRENLLLGHGRLVA